MAQNVGLVYGKPRVRKLSVLAGSVVNSVSLIHDGVTQANSVSISKEIAPFAGVTVSADVPASSTSATRSYHNGNEASEGNYYYNDVTNYAFGQWTGAHSGTTLSTSAVYSFQMPVYDETLTASGTVSHSEGNKVNAIALKGVNNSASDIATLNIAGDSAADNLTKYVWPGVAINISGDSVADSTDTTTYKYGNGTGSATADSGNTRWYMRTYHYVTAISGSDGTSISGSSGQITPSVAATYTFNGASSTSKTSITNAASTTITASNQTAAANSTYKTSNSSQKWYWVSSSENVNTKQYVSSSSWSTTKATGFSSSSTWVTGAGNTSAQTSSSSNRSTVKATSYFNGASSTWISQTLDYSTSWKTWTSGSTINGAGSTQITTWQLSSRQSNGVNASGTLHYTYQTLTTYPLTETTSFYQQGSCVTFLLFFTSINNTIVRTVNGKKSTVLSTKTYIPNINTGANRKFSDSWAQNLNAKIVYQPYITYKLPGQTINARLVGNQLSTIRTVQTTEVTISPYNDYFKLDLWYDPYEGGEIDDYRSARNYHESLFANLQDAIFSKARTVQMPSDNVLYCSFTSYPKISDQPQKTISLYYYYPSVSNYAEHTSSALGATYYAPINDNILNTDYITLPIDTNAIKTDNGIDEHIYSWVYQRSCSARHAIVNNNLRTFTSFNNNTFEGYVTNYDSSNSTTRLIGYLNYLNYCNRKYTALWSKGIVSYRTESNYLSSGIIVNISTEKVSTYTSIHSSINN